MTADPQKILDAIDERVKDCNRQIRFVDHGTVVSRRRAYFRALKDAVETLNTIMENSTDSDEFANTALGRIAALVLPKEEADAG